MDKQQAQYKPFTARFDIIQDVLKSQSKQFISLNYFYVCVGMICICKDVLSL